jgi:predicted ATPase
VLALFVPSEDKWNDFGLQVHADVGIRTSSREFDWVSGFLAFKGDEASRLFVQRLLREAKAQWIGVDRVHDSYATMLRNVKAYQQLVRHLGIQGAEDVAIAAHDAAFAHERARTLASWPDFTASPAFRRAFMRFSEASFAYDNAGMLFAGLTLDAEDARQDFTAIVKLGRSSFSYRFTFPQSEMIDNRIAVIIGRNGTGKTASLIALGRKLLDQNAKGAVIEPRPSFNQLLVYAHSRSLRRFRVSARNARAASQKTFSLDPTTTAGTERGLTTRVVAMARESDQLDSPLQALIDVLAAECDGMSVWVPITEEAGDHGVTLPHGRYSPLAAFVPAGEQAKLDRIGAVDVSRPLLFLHSDKERRKLSLGQDVFVSFALHAISQSGPASVFLVDEPENFLHPNLISRFMRLLNRILQRTKSIGIVATHSPFVVREVERSQVHVLPPSQEDGRISTVVEHPRLQTFGASVSSISDHIFGDDLLEHLHVELLNKVSLQDLPEEAWVDALKDHLSLDALMLLRQHRGKKNGQEKA